MPKKKPTTTRAWNAAGVPADATYTQRLADLKVAANEVGATAASRLDWIVKFAQEDPSTWQSSTRAARGNCILALTGFFYPEWFHGGVELPTPIPAEDVDEVHAKVSQMLRESLTGQAGQVTWLPDAAVRTGLLRLTAPSVKPAQWGAIHRYTSPLGVLHVLRDLILTAGEKLVACKRCGTPFVAVKKQEFCSPECNQDERNYRKKKVLSESTPSRRKQR